MGLSMNLNSKYFSAALLPSLTATFVTSSSIIFSSMGQTAEVTEQVIPNRPAGFLTGTYFQPSDIKDSDDIEFRQVDLHLKLPLGKTGEMEDGLLAYALNVREREIILEGPGNINDNKQRLYDISVPLTYVKKQDEETVYVANLSPGFKSSLEYVNTKDFAVNAVAQVIKSYDAHEYQYGLVYTNAFGKEKLLPLVAYRYKPNAHWDMTLGFPVTYVSYAPSWGQNYFAKVTPNGGSWHVYKDNNKDETFDYVQQGYRFGLGGQWKISGPFWLEFESGIQFGQELRLEDQNDVVIEADFENTSYVQLGINLHFGGPGE